MKRKTKYVYMGMLISILIVIVSIPLMFYFYDMKVVNCESITSSDYGVSTDDVTDCYKFYNFPFWNPCFLYYRVLMSPPLL